MNYEIIFESRATRELFEEWIWYEERQAGLGDKFENEVYKRIEQIKQNPERYPSRKKAFRESKIKRFPFLIIYKILEEEKIIFITSIFHTSRNPKSKYKQ